MYLIEYETKETHFTNEIIMAPHVAQIIPLIPFIPHAFLSAFSSCQVSDLAAHCYLTF